MMGVDYCVQYIWQQQSRRDMILPFCITKEVKFYEQSRSTLLRLSGTEVGKVGKDLRERNIPARLGSPSLT